MLTPSLIELASWTLAGTHRGEFFGVSATGRQTTVTGMVVDPLVAGKMAESRILTDSPSMMRQLGVIPAQQAVTRPPN